jgi:DNA polymerase I-like protein with 3'-5' exonuclease and polymerase domains
MLEYCVQDAQLNVKLFKLLEERMAKFELPEAAIELEHTARQICLEQEWTGVCFNEIAARQLEQRLRARAEEIKTEVRDTFEPNIIQLKTKTKTVPFNLASRQQIADRLIARGWVPTDYTPSGQPRVDDDVLAGIKGIPEAALLAEYFMLQKRLGQLADGKQAWLNKVDDKGRIHGSVDTLGTGTFRCSHSDPNMAQVPSSAAPFGRECRELFFAPEGYDMVGVDVSKLELVVLAHYMNDRKFSEAVIDGDVHQLLADVYGTDRRTGKTITYAFLYGAGLKKIGSVIAPTGSEKQQIKEGQIIHANMKKRLPALAMLSAGVKNKAEKDGHIKLIDGRRCPVRSAHSALNFLCQGSGAIICKKWMCNVHRDARTHGFVLNRHWFQVLFVHDELQFYVQKKLSAGFGEFCVQSIARAGKELGLRLPLTGEYNVGASWADTH